ncbi:MAG: hypothetical protein IPM54_26195 [Polyangiaceae bacterium]|nr:hypothetical protein [Polyangiaceae bacterium]
MQTRFSTDGDGRAKTAENLTCPCAYDDDQVVTMYRHLRTVAAMGLLGATTIGLTQLGCTSRLGPVHAKQTTPWLGRPELPDVTVARAADCVAEYGTQLEPGYHKFDSKVLVDEDGDKEDVTIDDIPNTAYDLGACMRNALRAMPIAEQPLREGVHILKNRREQPSAAERSLMGSPAVVVAGVTIVVSELVLEAGAYTFLFAVTVEVVDRAAKDAIEALRRRRPWENECQKKLNECLLSPLGSQWGDVHGTSRCVMCFKRCDKNGWPSGIKIDDDVYATCQYQ